MVQDGYLNAHHCSFSEGKEEAPFQDTLQLLLLFTSYCPEVVIWPNPGCKLGLKEVFMGGEGHFPS